VETLADFEEAFRTAMADAGVQYSGPIHADGRLHRIHAEGDSPGSRNAWFVLHGDGVPAGAFGTWKGAVTGTWRHGTRMSWLDRAQHRDRVMAAMKAANLERERANVDAALRAERVWNAAHPADPGHPYLVDKRVGVHGIRQHGDHLIVPVRDIDGALMTLQRIGPDGAKRFLPGGRVRGGMHRIGVHQAISATTVAPKNVESLSVTTVTPKNLPASCRALIVFAEGYSTAATIHESTGLPVFVAFNAGNLKPVAHEVFQAYGRRRYIVAADNDHQNEGNPGLTKAREAAKALQGARMVAPPGEPGVSDWNDWFQRRGPELILEVFA
jgi:putative DNA primase/helicase